MAVTEDRSQKGQVRVVELAKLSDGHERIAGCGVELARDQIGISAGGAGRILRGVARRERVLDQVERGDQKSDDVVLRPLADRL